MDIEKAKPSKGGDAKPWAQATKVWTARLPKCKKSILLLLLLIFSVLGGPQNTLANNLSWTVSSGQALGYRIYYGENCNDLRNYINVGNVYQHSLNSMPLNENKSYCFAVKAYNKLEESPFSNSVTWTASDNTPPSPPIEVKAQ
jgi:hypothetical protein